jgi:hypothetical protein
MDALQKAQEALSLERRNYITCRRYLEYPDCNRAFWYSEFIKTERRIADLEKQIATISKDNSTLDDLANSI